MCLHNVRVMSGISISILRPTIRILKQDELKGIKKSGLIKKKKEKEKEDKQTERCKMIENSFLDEYSPSVRIF